MKTIGGHIIKALRLGIMALAFCFYHFTDCLLGYPLEEAQPNNRKS